MSTRFDMGDEKSSKHKKKKKHKSDHHQSPHHSHKHKHKRRKREDEDDPLQTSTAKGLPPKAVFLEECGDLPPERAFRADYRADAANWEMLSLYVGHQARYRNLGYGCLGNNSTWQTAGHKKPPEKDRYWLNKIKKQGIKIKPFNGTIAMMNFIPVTDEYCGSTRQPPALHGDSPTPESRVGAKRQVLHKQVEAWPQDVGAWLELVDLQEQEVEFGGGEKEAWERRGGGMKATSDRLARRKVVQEMQAAVLSKALLANPGSVQLQKKQLEVHEGTWEAEKVVECWRILALGHVEQTDLAWGYITNLQSSLTVCSTDRLIEAAAECIHAALILPHLESHALDIFGHLLRTMKQAGLKEKAIALLQANIELNLLLPDVLQSASNEDKLLVLDAFWQSAAPRIGESKAVGFKAWFENRGMSTGSSNEQEKEPPIEGMNRFQAWLTLEMFRVSHQVFPWRPNIETGETEEDCEDLERIVLLDDIKSLVFCVNSQASKLKLIKLYMENLDLNLNLDIDRSRILRFGLENLSQISPITDLGESGLVSQPGHLEYRAALNVLTLVTSSQLFSDKKATFIDWTLIEVYIQYLSTRNLRQTDADHKSLYKEAKKACKNILKKPDNRNNLLLWDQYLVLEHREGHVDEARRIFNTALAMNLGESGLHSNDCLFRRRYAEREIGLHPGWKSTGVPNIAYILHILSSIPGVKSSTTSALANQLPTPTQRLATRRALSSSLAAIITQQLDNSLEQGLHYLPQAGSLLAHFTACYALYEYLTVGLQAAIKICDEVLHEVLLRKTAKEITHKNDETNTNENYIDEEQLFYVSLLEDLVGLKIALVNHSVGEHKAPFGELRQVLISSLQLLPDCPSLLHRYCLLEARSNITGRLRRHLLELTTNSSSPLVWIYGAVTELARKHAALDPAPTVPEWALMPPVPSSGTNHQLRAWFERAVSHKFSQQCVLLWRLFLFFEVKDGNQLGARAVYYRALSCCPLAKELCVDFVRAYPSHLQEVVDYMLEKQMRLYTPLEEVDEIIGYFTPPHQPSMADMLPSTPPATPIDMDTTE